MDHHPAQNTAQRSQALSLPSAFDKQYRVISVLCMGLFLWTALYAGMFVYHGAKLVLYPYDVDNSEAYLVYQGMRLAAGEFLYQPLEEYPYLVDNYPPLYPLVLAMGFMVTGTTFLWARMVSLAASIATGLILGLWTQSLTQNKAAAWLTGLAYLSFYHVYDWGALARVDALGVLLAVSAVVVFARSQKWLLPACLIVFALLTRQTLFASMLSILVILILQSRKREGIQFLLIAAGGYLTVFGAMAFFTGGQSILHMVTYNANEFRFYDVYLYARHWVFLYPLWGTIPVLVLFLVPFWKKETLSTQYDPVCLLAWFSLFAIAEALLCGKIGSAPNYLLSLACAASVGLGYVFHQLLLLLHHTGNLSATVRQTPILLFLLASLLQSFNAWHCPETSRDWALTPNTEYIKQGIAIDRILQRHEGPIISDRAGIALEAGHPPVFQPFILSQLSHQGLFDQDLINDRILNKEFSAMLLHFDLSSPNWDRERFTLEMIAAMRQSYRLNQQYGSYYLYQPVE